MRLRQLQKKIGAVNTVVNDNGVLKGYNTDWLGTVTPLEDYVGVGGLKGKKVALIGAGGAARAMAFGVVEKGVELTIYNRTIKKAQVLAKELGCVADSINNIEKVVDADIIINSTSLGMGENTNSIPVPKEYLKDRHICVDAV